MMMMMMMMMMMIIIIIIERPLWRVYVCRRGICNLIDYYLLRPEHK